MFLEKKELKFYIKWTILLLFLSSLPYFLGLFFQNKDFKYSGYSTANSADFSTYLGWSYQAKEGFYFLKDRYTTEEHKQIFFHPVFFLIGKFSSLFNLNLVTCFHIFRIIFNIIFILSVYFFISYFQPDNQLKKYTFIFATISSGFGGYLVAAGIINTDVFSVSENLPVDIWLPEAIPFWSMYGIYLFSISVSLILLSYLFYLKAIAEDNYKFSILAGFFLFLLLLIHPYDTLAVLPVIILYSLYLIIIKKKKIIKHFLIIITFALLPPLYNIYFFHINKVFKNWADIPRYSPSIYNYFIGFGISFVFGIIAIKRIIVKQKSEKEIFLLFWIIINFLMLYFPVSFQRRLVEGIYIPLAIISFPVIFEFAEYISQKIKKDMFTTLRVIIILSTFSNIAVFATEIKVLSVVEFPYYLPTKLLNTFNYIKKNTPYNSIFLSSYSISNFIPALTGRIVYSGHYDQTLFFNEKKLKVKRFFERKEDCKWKNKFLKENKINYLLSEKNSEVFYSPGEFTANFFNDSCSFFKLIYQNKKYKIYKIFLKK